MPGETSDHVLERFGVHRQAGKQQHGDEVTCQRQPAGKWQKKRARVSGLESQLLAAGHSLCCWVARLCLWKKANMQSNGRGGTAES